MLVYYVCGTSLDDVAIEAIDCVSIGLVDLWLGITHVDGSLQASHHLEWMAVSRSKRTKRNFAEPIAGLEYLNLKWRVPPFTG